MQKTLHHILSISLMTALISAIAGLWIFEMNWPFLPVPLLAGAIMIFTQHETKSYKFLPKLLIGSLLFGFLAWLFIFIRMYLVSNFIYHSGFPFWIFYNPKEYLIFSLIFSFVCFMGGLIGIVITGGYLMIKESK